MIRRKAIKVASYIASKSGVTTSLDRWNSSRGGIILVFHDVSKETLTTHLNIVAKRYEFVSLTTMVRRIAQYRSTARLAAITFDDGLRDVIEAAAELAQQRAWPMTFFLPTGGIDRQQPFWFQEIDALLLRAKGKTLILGDARYELRDDATIKRISDELDLRFKSHTTEEQSRRLLNEIKSKLFAPPARLDGMKISKLISWERVAELARRNELRFESHSVTHPATSRLGSVTLMKELVDSKKRIEEVTGRTVEHFCYPYGASQDIGTEAPQLVRKLFRSGNTMTRGRCGRTIDPALLPRLALYEEDPEEVVALKIGTAR